jgi:hypothetical protein
MYARQQARLYLSFDLHHLSCSRPEASSEQVTLKLGDEFPNFHLKTTIGDIQLHDWIGEGSVLIRISSFSTIYYLVGAFFSLIRLISHRFAQLN